jgi:hypothetical protein
MRQLVLVSSVALLSLIAPHVHAARDVIDDAYMLCKVFENTGMSTECNVRGGSSSVEVTLDTNGVEGRKICASVVAEMATVTGNFAGKWKLKIFSPYSGNRPIAVCTLR